MNYGVVPEFLLHSTSASAYITYHLALSIQSSNNFISNGSPDTRFVGIKDLKVYVHYGPVASIEYGDCRTGEDYRMPRIVFAD